MERGLAFFAAARLAAAKMQVPFNWSIEYAEDVEHDHGGMAAAAVPFLVRTAQDAIPPG
ncbi:MAG: hypothetical protein HC890_18395 [Chloroflexaceae bacterium]|nr:hypothetical protein [Chloroflexaceae bacterium]